MKSTARVGEQDMGWEGPAHPQPCWLGHLIALVVSLLLTCGPGKWDWAGPVEEPDRFPEERGRGDWCLGLPKPPQGQPGGLMLFGTGLHHSRPGEGYVFCTDLS